MHIQENYRDVELPYDITVCGLEINHSDSKYSYRITTNINNVTCETCKRMLLQKAYESDKVKWEEAFQHSRK